MSVFSTTRRRLLLGAGCLLFFLAISLTVVHTSVARRFVFVQIQSWLQKTTGLILNAGDFHYNLLACRFELKDVTLRTASAREMPSAVQAKRLIVLSPWKALVRGDFEAAQVRIEGLTIHWFADRDGRNNWPAFAGSGASSSFFGPALVVAGGAIYAEDRQHGLEVSLPLRRLSAIWKPAAREYAIAGESAGGAIQWKRSRFGLDRLLLESAVTDVGFAIRSLKLVSGESDAEISGNLSGSPSRLEATAKLNLDLFQLGQAAWATPARGRIICQLSATGALDALQFKASLSGESAAVGGMPIRDLAARAVFDVRSGELQIPSLSAGIFSGQLAASGRVAIGTKPGRSEFAADIRRFDLRRMAAALGIFGIPAGPATARVVATWPGVEWRAGAFSGMVQLRSARLVLRGTGGDFIRASVVASVGDAAAIRGNLAIRQADYQLTGKLNGTATALSRLDHDLARLFDISATSVVRRPLEGATRFSIALGGTVQNPTASLRLGIEGLSVAGWRGASLDLSAGYAANRVTIDTARLTWAGLRIEVKGAIGGVSSNAPVELAGFVQAASLARVLERLGIAPSAEASIKGDLHIAGTLSDPAVETSVYAERLTVFGGEFPRASAEAYWRDGKVTFRRLSVQQSSQVDMPRGLEANGCLDVAGSTYEIDATGRNLRLEGLDIPGTPALAGTFQIKASGKGSFADLRLDTEFAGSGVKVGPVPIGELRGNVHAAGGGATAVLIAPDLNAEVSSTVSLRGPWPFELTVDARGADVPAAGLESVAARLTAGGRLAQPRLERGVVHIDQLRLATPAGEVINDGPITMSLADQRIRVEQLALKSGDSGIRVSGEMPLEDGQSEGTLSVHGTVDIGALSNGFSALSTSSLTGIADVDATITGAARNWVPQGSLTIREARFGWGPLPVEEIAGVIRFENGILRIDRVGGKAGSGTVKLVGSVPMRMLARNLPFSVSSSAEPAHFSAQVDDFQWSGGPTGGSPTVTVGMKIEGEASALSLDALRAQVEFTELSAKTKTDQLRQATRARITIENGAANLEALELKGAASSLRASGSVSLTRQFPLQVDAVATSDISLLSVFTSPLDIAGVARLDLHAGGTLSGPRIAGSVELDGASLALPDPSLQARNVRLRANLNGDQITVTEISGTLNGGTFEGRGGLKVDARGLRDVNFSMTAKDTLMELPSFVKTSSSLNLKLVSRANDVVLTGEIEVQDGTVEKALDIFSQSDGEVRSAPAATPAPASRAITLDIAVRTKRPIEMNNNLGRVAATADLRLAGSTAEPRLLGTLELEKGGRFYFGDRTYYVERGTVNFREAPKTTPDLNIRAYTRTRDYTIYLGLAGEPNAITTTFTSDPPLSRDDVIAVLLTGKTVADNRGVDLRALEATALAAGALNASLSSQLRGTRVSVQPSAIAAESNVPGTRITITQDFTSAMRLIYSMNLSDSNDQIWVGEYDLSRRFTTRAVKESDNSYRGEFRHDIRFGSSSPGSVQAASRAPKQRISTVQFTGGGSFPNEELLKHFKVKAGKWYNAQNVRKGAERLNAFLTKKGYLESRVRLDRQEEPSQVAISVRIELGPIIQMAFLGAQPSRHQKTQSRKAWRAGISDQQRTQAVKNSLLDYLTEKGYPQAKAEFAIDAAAERKTVQFEITSGHKYKSTFALEGANPQHSREVLSMIDERSLRVAVYRDPGRIVERISSYYQQRGYLAADVARPAYHFNFGRGTSHVIIPVQEGPAFRVGKLTFSGNRALSDEQLCERLMLESGGIFEPARVEPSLAALKLKYGKLGYREAEITYEIVRHDDKASVDVAFKVDEKKKTSIGSVTVAGNRHTSEEYARNAVLVSAGDVANAELLRDSVKNLSQTGAYSSADLKLQPRIEAGAAQNPVQVADLLVAVREPKPFRLLYGGLYDSGSGPGFIVDLQNVNMLGGGRTLGLRGRYDSETNEARVYATQPTWNHRRVSTTVSLYYDQSLQYHQTTPTQKVGVSLQQEMQLRSNLQFSYAYRYEKQHDFVPDPAAPDIPVSIVALGPLSFTISRDTRDSFLDATHGSFMSQGFELAPKFLGSDYPYLRSYMQYFKYFPLTRPRPVPFGEKQQRSRLIFATGTRLGLQKGFNPAGAVLTDRFYAGGGTTVRGFRQDELGPRLENGQPAGGNAVLVLNEELRFPLFSIFDAVSFVDIGNVFPRVSDFKISELRGAAGFGLRIRNPFVVLRFDYGFKFARRPGEKMGAFFFSIGQAF